VLLMSLLPLAQYFFGIWGLILAAPVAVYVIHVLILRRGLPGAESARKSPPPEGSGPGRDTPVQPADGEKKSEAVAAPA
jgi:hypothetical protein